MHKSQGLNVKAVTDPSRFEMFYDLIILFAFKSQNFTVPSLLPEAIIDELGDMSNAVI
jgi:hypothetical protein